MAAPQHVCNYCVFHLKALADVHGHGLCKLLDAGVAAREVRLHDSLSSYIFTQIPRDDIKEK